MRVLKGPPLEKQHLGYGGTQESDGWQGLQMLNNEKEKHSDAVHLGAIISMDTESQHAVSPFLIIEHRPVR